MHNGVVAHFNTIRRALSDSMGLCAYENVKGTTDSEHLAAVYMTVLTGETPGEKEESHLERWEKTYSIEEMENALRMTILKALEAQKELVREKRAPSSLNLAATDGVKMYVFSGSNGAVEDSLTLE